MAPLPLPMPTMRLNCNMSSDGSINSESTLASSVPPVPSAAQRNQLPTVRSVQPVPPHAPTDPPKKSKNDGGWKGRTFPYVLHEILASPGVGTSISWLPDGKAWTVNNGHEFVEKVCPVFFRHSNQRSFMQNVRNWGFHELVDEGGNVAYYHEYFVRGQEDLCQHMFNKQSKAKRTGQSVASLNNSGSAVRTRTLVKTNLAAPAASHKSAAPTKRASSASAQPSHPGSVVWESSTTFFPPQDADGKNKKMPIQQDTGARRPGVSHVPYMAPGMEQRYVDKKQSSLSPPSSNNGNGGLRFNNGPPHHPGASNRPTDSRFFNSDTARWKSNNHPMHGPGSNMPPVGFYPSNNNNNKYVAPVPQQHHHHHHQQQRSQQNQQPHSVHPPPPQQHASHHNRSGTGPLFPLFNPRNNNSSSPYTAHPHSGSSDPLVPHATHHSHSQHSHHSSPHPMDPRGGIGGGGASGPPRHPYTDHPQQGMHLPSQHNPNAANRGPPVHAQAQARPQPQPQPHHSSPSVGSRGETSPHSVHSLSPGIMRVAGGTSAPNTNTGRLPHTSAAAHNPGQPQQYTTKSTTPIIMTTTNSSSSTTTTLDRRSEDIAAKKNSNDVGASVVNDDMLMSYIQSEKTPISGNPGIDLYAKQTMILEQSRLLAERQAAICEQSRILASIQARNAAETYKRKPQVSMSSPLTVQDTRDRDSAKSKEQSNVLNETQASIFERSRDLAIEQASLFAEQQKIMAEIEARREAEEASLILALDLHRGETQGAGYQQNDESHSRMDTGP